MILPKRNWSRLIGSILVLIAGIIGIFNPKIASATIVALIGAALMISGALRIGFYLSGSKLSSGWDMGSGVLDIVGAFFILANGRATATVLTVFIGLYVIVQGVLSIITGIRAHNLTAARAWWVSVAYGIAACILGLLMVIHPVATSLGMGALLGIYFVIVGALGIGTFIADPKQPK